MSTVVLVDDHPVVRRGLRTLLETQPDFEVVGETSNGFQAVQEVERLKPDVAVLDLMIEGINGIEVAKQLNRNKCSTAIVVFTVLVSEHYVLEAFFAGVKGYILKEAPADELLHGIREVVAGRRYLCSTLQEQPYVQQMSDGFGADIFRGLTAREREVLQCSAQGRTCAEIASQLNISRRTVEAHRANMMRKLGLSSVTALYKYAFQQELSLNKERFNPIGPVNPISSNSPVNRY